MCGLQPDLFLCGDDANFRLVIPKPYLPLPHSVADGGQLPRQLARGDQRCQFVGAEPPNRGVFVAVSAFLDKLIVLFD